MTRRVDFLHPNRPPAIGWVLLVLGAMAMGTAVVVTREWAHRRAEVERIARLHDEREERARLEAAKPVLPTPAQVRLGQVASDLRRPWLRTLKVIESVSEPPIYVLSLGVSPGEGQVRLDAEAPTFAEAVAYVRALNDDGVLTGAQLRSHEGAVDPISNQPIVRFGVTAQWVPR